MMRTIGLAAAVLFVAGQAQATSSIDLQWQNTGTSTVTVSSVAGTTLIADVVVAADTAGIKGMVFSFVFDADLRDELNWVGGAETVGVGKCGSGCSFAPASPGFTDVQIESTSTTAGVVGSFDSFTLNGSLVSKTRTMGTIIFSTNALNVVDDGVDIQITLLNNALDAIIPTAGGTITANLGGGVVNSGRPPTVPEPTTALLMVAGVLGLGLAGRRVARK
jgi:hypothetical protein